MLEALEALEPLEEMDEDEFDRGRDFRGTNMPRPPASSEFIAPLPLIVPHAGRLICGKVGGLATAVMEEGSGGAGPDDFEVWRSSSLSGYQTREARAPSARVAPPQSSQPSNVAGQRRASSTGWRAARWNRRLSCRRVEAARSASSPGN